MYDTFRNRQVHAVAVAAEMTDQCQMRTPHTSVHRGGISAIPAVSPWKLGRQFLGQTIALILLGLSLKIIFASTSALMCHPVSPGRDGCH